MARAIQAETEAVNADSFLDIVASVVSIMIIMVLMTGLKIKNTPVDVPLVGEAAMLQADLGREVASEKSVRTDVLKMAGEIEALGRETAARQQHRDMLALAVTAIEGQIGGSQEQIADKSQEDSVLAVKIGETRAKLASLQRQEVAVENAPGAPVQVESYPTPISRTVDGREIHFQLRGGRLVFVPFDALAERFKADAPNRVYKLRDQPELTETIGPEGGFRLRYTLERVDPSDHPGQDTGHRGAYVKVKQIEFVPVADDLGETVEESLAGTSNFRSVLADRRWRGAAITIWTYPDSFDAFRRIKKELYRLGFAVAARPLPDGTYITGSPEGSKSAAQ